MSINESTQSGRRGAAPGVIEPDLGALSRATDSAHEARLGVAVEERRLRVAAARGGREAAEQERRVDDARRDLEHAEAFEQALESSEA
ncbi:hypothetical protein OVA26_16190 [Microbacterium sp. SL62]|uniref:hypothetical protein n=1 Tax=Microbacterium sp. SL62 TaxID=2995139 RepID=UPI0022726633|nr:hypothetical protein [Microbacterium sp. SL62]MCY1718476.1 hypothetical protein [Microbacterium sp. SL62]